MMKFREFYNKHRAKKAATKTTNQLANQHFELNKPARVSDVGASYGADDRDLPPAVIPPTFGTVR
jgi:hypothetical protein